MFKIIYCVVTGWMPELLIETEEKLNKKTSLVLCKTCWCTHNKLPMSPYFH